MNRQQFIRIVSLWLDGESSDAETRQMHAAMAAEPDLAAIFGQMQLQHDQIRGALPAVQPPAQIWQRVSQAIDWPAPDSPPGVLQTLQTWWQANRPVLSSFQAGFATAVLILVAGWILMRSTGFLTQTADPVLVATRVAPPDAAEVTLAAGEPLHDQIQRYLERSAVLLLELKNSESSVDQHLYPAMQRNSRELLDETIVLKKQLNQTSLIALQNLVEELEVALLDIAGMEAQVNPDDLASLKTVLLRKNLLLKIEITDLRSLKHDYRLQGMDYSDADATQNPVPF